MTRFAMRSIMGHVLGEVLLVAFGEFNKAN